MSTQRYYARMTPKLSAAILALILATEPEEPTGEVGRRGLDGPDPESDATNEGRDDRAV